MANVQHNTLTGAEVHQEKLISAAGTIDAGQVVTPSAADAGEGVLRNLVYSEVDNKLESAQLYFADIGTAITKHVVADHAGKINKVWSVIDTAPTGSDTTLTVKINGTNTSPSNMTVTQSGGAAGDIDSVTPTSLNTYSAGDTLEVTSDGGATNAVAAMITFALERT